jgi:hypothetical protein
LAGLVIGVEDDIDGVVAFLLPGEWRIQVGNRAVVCARCGVVE